MTPAAPNQVKERLQAVVAEQLLVAVAEAAVAGAAVAAAAGGGAASLPTAGPEPEPPGDSGVVSELYEAAKTGDDAAVARLLAAGADPNASVGRRQLSAGKVLRVTALLVAAQQVRKPPSWARSWAKFSLLELYHHRNAWPTCIFWANLTPFSLQGHMEAARLLLEGGADPELGCSDDTTPLMEAAGRGHLDVMRLLMARGVVLDAATPDTGMTSPGS